MKGIFDMERVAAFSKVSRDIFIAALAGNDCFEGMESAYADIMLPKRATTGSAGYDFFIPFDLELGAGKTALIPTGIRARINDGWVLMIFPRSGLGFKYRVQLDNTVGIIDSDYYGSSNEGHIMVKITNDSRTGKTLSLTKGQGFAQGIFLPFGITEDDSVSEIRDGGFGSTTK